MGLQGQLNDIGSDSIPLYLVALLAALFNNLRTLFLGLFSNPNSPESDPFTLLGTGLAGLVVLSEHLTLNRHLSYTHSSGHVRAPDGPAHSDCVFCLSGLNDGDRVRRLSCCHVFHKDCLDGWLDQMRFTCPLCRSPVAADERVGPTSDRDCWIGPTLAR